RSAAFHHRKNRRDAASQDHLSGQSRSGPAQCAPNQSLPKEIRRCEHGRLGRTVNTRNGQPAGSRYGGLASSGGRPVDATQSFLGSERQARVVATAVQATSVVSIGALARRNSEIGTGLPNR